MALGCIYRSKGGIALRALVGHVAGTLLAVAKASSGVTHVWLLHALWLLANSAGLLFIPNVKVRTPPPPLPSHHLIKCAGHLHHMQD